jgi:hypothetical protein
MRVSTGIVIWVATVLPCSVAWADGNGLTADANRVPWGSVHGRIAYASTSGLNNAFLFSDSNGLRSPNPSVVGDFYFSGWGGGDKYQTGGFRATSGIVVGTRNDLWATPGVAPASGLLSVSRRLFGQTTIPSANALDANADNATLPYIGVGYSSLAMRSGWSFSADLGMVSLNPGNAVRLGRVFVGGQSLDDVVHDMHLAPVLQLGVSYSF